MSKTPEDRKFERFLAVLQLILTAITGIGVALFVSARQEEATASLNRSQQEFQKQFITYQREAELAQLEITQSCNRESCPGTTIRNLSNTASAENLNVVLTLVQIGEQARGVITGLESLTWNHEPSSIDVQPKMEHSTGNSGASAASIAGNNLLKLHIEKLPPGADLVVEMQYLGGSTPGLSKVSMEMWLLPSTTLSITETESITAPAEPPGVLGTKVAGPWDQILDTAIRDYVQHNYSLATFTVSATCDNCRGEAGQSTLQVGRLIWNTSSSHYLSLPPVPTNYRQLLVTYAIPQGGRTLADRLVHLEVLVTEGLKPRWRDAETSP
ncbi:MAG: hypothetical protein QOH93_1339 [Chloroflexia bacterium]|nr:hypothetical protein [Chloroflexia bacterium]